MSDWIKTLESNVIANQIAKIKSDWTKLAKEQIRVDKVDLMFVATGSELAIRRIANAYRKCEKQCGNMVVRVKSNGRWSFCLDVNYERNKSLLNYLKVAWSEMAENDVVVERVCDTYYGYGTELEMLRIMSHYENWDQELVKVAWSANLNTWFFRVESST